MVNVCALRCIGKENKEKQFDKSEFSRERGRGKIKDNKNEPNADVESQHAKNNHFSICFENMFYRE